MRLGQLTDEGIAAFSEFLGALSDEASVDRATELLEVHQNVAAIPHTVELEPRVFPDKRSLGRYLDAKLDGLEQNWLGAAHRTWAFITVYYFSQLCPKKKDGSTNSCKSWYYIPSVDFRTDYRHKVRAPYFLYRRFQDAANVLLTVPVETHGDFLEQLGSRMEIITNQPAIEVIDRLYWDDQNERVKSGASDRKKPGTLRRFLTVLQQYERTYDLYSVDADQLMELLPAEFDRFKDGLLPPADETDNLKLRRPVLRRILGR